MWVTKLSFRPSTFTHSWHTLIISSWEGILEWVSLLIIRLWKPADEARNWDVSLEAKEGTLNVLNDLIVSEKVSSILEWLWDLNFHHSEANNCAFDLLRDSIPSNIWFFIFLLGSLRPILRFKLSHPLFWIQRKTQNPRRWVVQRVTKAGCC